MAIWHQGSLGGFDASKVELAGRIVGKRPGEWRFDDGEGIRWIPKEYIHKYRYLANGYCIIVIPSWLAKRRRYRMKRVVR